MPMKSLYARQVFDSQGIPTIEVDLVTDLGIFRTAGPSGVTQGDLEPLDIRDNEKSNYFGKSVKMAVNTINEVIAPELLAQNLEVVQQSEIDDFMIQLDGTENFSKLGVNTILPISVTCAKAGAAKRGLPLYKHIADLANNKTLVLPVPVLNVLNGGRRSSNKIPFEEFMILPTGAETFAEAMKLGTEVYQQLKNVIQTKYGVNAIYVGDEGGFAPNIKTPKDAFVLIKDAIKKTGYEGRVEIAMKASATEFFKQNQYDMDFKNPKSDKKKWLKSDKLSDLYMKFIKDYPLTSIEDPFHKDAIPNWVTFTEKTNIQVVTDALTFGNVTRIQEAIDKNVANCFILKINQIGTVTGIIRAHGLARNNGWGTLISGRIGDNDDTFTADLAVGLSAGQLKAGGPCRGERLSKYNQLIRIEEEMEGNAKYAGKAYRKPSS